MKTSMIMAVLLGMCIYACMAAVPSIVMRYHPATIRDRHDRVSFEIQSSEGVPIFRSRALPVVDETTSPFSPALEEITQLLDTQKTMVHVVSSHAHKGLSFVMRNYNNRVIGFSTQDFTNVADLERMVDEVQTALDNFSLKMVNDGTDIRHTVTLSYENDVYYVLYDGKTETFESKSSAIAHLAKFVEAKDVIVDLTTSDVKVLSSPSRRHLEGIDSENDPAIFHLQNLEYNYETIKKSGWQKARVARVPWPESYYPTFEDGLNARWQHPKDGRTPEDRICTSDIDCMSPLQKYDMAFNGWKPSADFFKYTPYNPNTMCGNSIKAADPKGWDDKYYAELGPAGLYQTFKSRMMGNYICHNHIDDSQSGMVDNCALNGCEYNGKYPLLARWFGLCHAWAPASILLPEPQKSVTSNNVEFQISDMKSLSMMHNFPSTILGTRCNLQDIPTDEFGRISADECRDINPGAYHVVLANLVGKEKRSLVEDRTLGQVWNQPVAGFSVDFEKTIEKPQEACEWLGGCKAGGSSVYNWNPKATKWVAIRSSIEWVAEAYPSRKPRAKDAEAFISSNSYDYLLELDSNGNIIGGEWKFNKNGADMSAHPDFLWLPYSMSRGALNNPQMTSDKIMDLFNHGTASTDNSRKLRADAHHRSFSSSGKSSIHVPASHEEERVFQAYLTVDADIPEDTRVILSHGLSKVSLTIDHVTKRIPIYAFANQVAAGEWTISHEDNGVTINDWVLELKLHSN